MTTRSVGSVADEICSSPNTTAEKNGAKDVGTIAALLKKGMFGPGAFRTADCRKTFAKN